VLTLTGPGGAGKTRLALEVARRLVDAFPDGVFWVPLAALREPQLVVPAIEQTLGVKTSLQDHVDEKRILLLLDNLEQVLEAGSQLADLIARCPNLRLLVTSRAPLRIAGEREYQMPPLSDADAAALFRARAADAEPMEAVAAICQRLDGLPLAIELAAARTRVLPPEQLLERLEQRLPLLTRGRSEAPERQRTLRATIAWSHDLLAADEQQLFARLSVFAGGFTIRAAEEVCNAEVDALESLVEKNLIRREVGRFSMLETIREYGGECLAVSDRAEEVVGRHTAYFLALAEQAEPKLGGPEVGAWLDHLELEHSNLRAALGWAIRGRHANVALGM
jgi:predicted ATPase